MHTRPSPIRLPTLALVLCAGVAVPAAGYAQQQDVPDPRHTLAGAERAPRSGGGADAVRELHRLDDLVAIGAADAAGLTRAADLAITLAVLAGDRGDEAERRDWLTRAEAYAREAHALEPERAEPRFLIAAALGLGAVHQPVRERIRTAAEVREHAEAVLLLDPGHAGALHLVGQLNAAAMRLNPFLRFVAKTVLGGDALGGASWARAEAAFRGAINREPGNPAHRVELARVLRDTGRIDEARAELEAALALESRDPLAPHFRARAERVLAALR